MKKIFRVYFELIGRFDNCSQGMLVLSLALGETITGDVKEIPTSLPSELRDFLSK